MRYFFIVLFVIFFDNNIIKSERIPFPLRSIIRRKDTKLNFKSLYNINLFDNFMDL